MTHASMSNIKASNTLRKSSIGLQSTMSSANLLPTTSPSSPSPSTSTSSSLNLLRLSNSSKLKVGEGMESVFIYLDFKNIICPVGEATTLYFSVYDSIKKTFLSEEFKVDLNPSGMPLDIKLVGNCKVIFRVKSFYFSIFLFFYFFYFIFFYFLYFLFSLYFYF